jgi:glycosyltransferase involved in cell wall biosynthesis
MRLVFLTQVLDRHDAVLGFVVRWVEAFAGRCERVRVIALEVGDVSDLPENVDVRCIGRRGRLLRYLRNARFLEQALGRERFDAVLAHMVPRYALLARRAARRHGARLYLWYTHGGVDQRLRRAERAVQKIFTASEESLRLVTEKRVVTGHGIDLDHFDPHGALPAQPPRLLAVGRMTPAKDPLTLVRAVGRLRQGGRDLHLDLVGDVLASGDEAYLAQVRSEVAALGLGEAVRLWGAVPYRDVPPYYHRATALVSASRTGSVDKVVLEAMAARRPVLTSNDSFPRLFAELGPLAERLYFPSGDVQALAQRLEWLLDRTEAERAALGERLFLMVRSGHEVERLIARLVREMEPGAVGREGGRS